MATIEEQIEAAKKRLDQLKARKQKVEAQKRAAEQKRSRQEDTRRKILLGAMLLDQMEKDAVKKDSVMEDLNAFLARADDRTLFGLKIEPSLLDLVKATRPSVFEKRDAA